MPRKREPAIRTFANELNRVMEITKGDDQYDPTFAHTILERKVSRVLIAGVAISVECNDMEKKEADRSRYTLIVQDPTGKTYVRVDEYTPACLPFVRHLETPCYVKLVGKVRTFQPEENGRIFASVKPEHMIKVEQADYVAWLNESIKLAENHYKGLDSPLPEQVSVFEKAMADMRGFCDTATQEAKQCLSV